MLSQKIFKDGLKELENVFDGFTLTESKLKTWYKYSKHLEDYIWEKKIANCIKGCRKIPTLADILDIKGYYREDTPPPYDKYYEEEEYERGKQPEEAKKNMGELYKKIGYVPKLKGRL